MLIAVAGCIALGHTQDAGRRLTKLDIVGGILRHEIMY